MDNLDQRAMERILMRCGLSETAISIIKDLWEDEIVMKFQDNTFGSTFSSKRGVYQGDVLFPAHFYHLSEHGTQRHSSKAQRNSSLSQRRHMAKLGT